MNRDEEQRYGGAPQREPTDLPQTEKKHPDQWERDLNPDRMGGQNIGTGRDLPSARDRSETRRGLNDFEPEELEEISIVPPGTRLQQGATYLDLAADDRTEFTATADMVAGERERLVPKADVSYTLWNRLRGIEDPDRTA